MKVSREVKETTNNAVYKKAIKLLRDHQKKISCGRCPYHKGENGGRRRRYPKRK